MSEHEDVDGTQPSGDAPTGHGTAGRSTHRVLRSGLVTATALGALVGAFVLGTHVQQDPTAGPAGPRTSGSGTGPDAGTSTGGGMRSVAFHTALKAAPSCSALTQHYVDSAIDRVGEYGWGSGGVLPYASAEGAGRTTMADLSASSKDAVPSSATGTNTQEAGVDEPDLVKTDGSVLARIRDDRVDLYDVKGATPLKQGSIVLPRFGQGELILSGTTLLAIGQGPRSYRTQNTGTGRQTRVVSLDISDPTRPRVTHTTDYDAALLSARQHGSVVRLVMSAGLPEFDFLAPGGQVGRKEARLHNQQLVQDSTANDWLPSVTDDAGTQKPLLGCEQVALPRENLGLDTVAVVGIDVADPTQRSTVGVATEASTVYEADDRLFLAAMSWGDGWGGCCWDMISEPAAADAGRTHLFDFKLDGTEATYHGSATIAGAVKDRWSLDWAHGTLRVAAGRSRATGNHNSVVVLEEGPDNLRRVARLRNLGIDEDIKSVRWFDKLAIVVTFRETDPLYTIDLSDPRSPRMLGALKIPGFSEYLHPVGEHLLIGMGQGDPGSGGGAQAALFDISDVQHPQRLDVVTYGPDTQALAGEDPRTFQWLPRTRTAVTMIRSNWSDRNGRIAILRPRDGLLQQHTVPVPVATALSQVRVVPVRRGAVLVAGDTVRGMGLALHRG